MNSPFDPDTIGFLIGDIARLIKADLDRRIVSAGIGVTPGEARTLLHAARAGEVRQNVLADRMGLEAMTLSAYLDRVEERGLIRRVPDPSDRRAKLVRLTDAGVAAVQAIMQVTKDIRLRARGRMNDEDWAQLNHLLKQVRTNFTEGA
ncbi:MarR family winged helix-turn-helix transcriptional regulator [Chelativorans sp. Marseille-P2723]|uniref:MarR family winged helix-turn-helix transcriptional regulator n=1 Tax=Chelativorans sp. Marseille-P2723 TaxID=2709133 RepID=UPI00156FAB05|nr:MarR family winged helix-turn-helix transcriptional regulator [Chelativorans sp. Marseille-P2723]